MRMEYDYDGCNTVFLREIGSLPCADSVGQIASQMAGAAVRPREQCLGGWAS